VVSAAWNGELEEVKQWIDGGTCVNAEDDRGRTALIEAARMGYMEIVEYLAEEAKANLDVRDKDGATALAWAAYKSHLEVTRYLIERGADIEAAGNRGHTPLLEAVRGVRFYGKAVHRHFQVVRCLVEHKANVEAKTSSGATPLAIAADFGFFEMVQYLIEHAQANIEAKSDKTGDTALIRAAKASRPKVVRYLLEEAKANIDAEDLDGWTAYNWARRRVRQCHYGSEEVVADLTAHLKQITAKRVRAVRRDLETVWMLFPMITDAVQAHYP